MGELINGRTPEEIKRRLKCASFDCSDIDCDDCECRDLCKSLDVLSDAANALAYIQHLEAQQPKWISVKERLPEESGYYFCLCDKPHYGLKNGVDVSYFQHKAKIWKKIYYPCVTHWMPMPEPPEEDE